MPTTEQLYRDVLSLPREARVDLTERLVESLAADIPEEITKADLAEIDRRIEQIERGEIELVPGDEVLGRARRILTDRKDDR